MRVEEGDLSTCLELENHSTEPGDARRPANDPYRGVPHLTAIDPSLQHADSTTQVFGCVIGDVEAAMVRILSCRLQFHAGVRARTADLPIFRSRDNSSPNTVNVRDLGQHINPNTDERRRT